MPACFVHAAVDATGACDDCKKPICTRCTKGTLEGFMCPPCAHKRYARRKWATGFKVAALVIVLVGLGVFGLIVVGKGSERPKTGPDAGPVEKDPLIAALREARDLAPCDHSTIHKLTGELSKARRYAEVVDDANRFFAKCGSFPRLAWTVIYALQQLGRYTEALKYETVVIEDDPFDADFWWWRGEDRARTQQEPGALSDYRQSFANSKRWQSARFAAGRILDVAGPASQPCEGVFALDFFVSVLAGELSDDLTRRARGLDQSSQCGALRGTGTITLAIADDGTVHADATVNGVAGKFVVDSSTGTTVLSTGFAQRAQLVARPGPPIQTLAFAKVVAGAPTSAEIKIGPAAAAAVEVVLVDGLPPDVDGILGLSFLWRFEQVIADDAVTLEPGHAP